jgi:hypothetical protein
MNIKLKQSFTFAAGAYMDGALDILNYHVTLHLITGSDNQDDTTVAVDRIREFVDQMAGTIFINREDVATCQALDNLGISITSLPEDPVDQVVGIMFHCKLNAIAEGRMLIVVTEITSDSGISMTFVHEHDDELGPFADPGWWHENTLRHCEDSFSDSDNVVIIRGNSAITDSWNNLGLAWPDDDDADHSNTLDNSVVFANFGKHDSK